jgi:MscS family membrane protein
MKKTLLGLLLFTTTLASAGPWDDFATESPRQTVETFVKAMNDYRAGVIENNLQKQRRIYDAIRCFHEPDSSLLTSQREKEVAAVLFKEVIDRVSVIDFETFPDSTDAKRWRLPKTDIILKPVPSGDREGEWLITASSWRSAKEFYERVKHLPYLPKSGQGALYEKPWMEKNLPEWTRKETFSLKNWQWLGMAFGLALGLVFWGILRVFTFLMNYFRSSKTKEPPFRFVAQIEKPLALTLSSLFWLAWLRVLRLQGFAHSLTNSIVQVLLGIAMTWAALTCVHYFAERFRQTSLAGESSLDDQLIPFLERGIKVVITLLGILIVLQNMGLNVGSILAGLGLGGLAVVLAAQDTAANLFGSIMILVDRPFKVGDWVLMNTTEGVVEDIGFRSTRIRTFHNSLVAIPNKDMANAKIDTMGERAYRRTKVTLDITYETSPEKMELFIEGIKGILRKHEMTRKDYFHVVFSGYGESSLQVMVYFFLITNDWSIELKERQKIFFAIYHLAKELEVNFAYPTRTLLHSNSSPCVTKGSTLQI